MLDLLTAYPREQMSINNLVMTWNEFTQREKAAMLKSLIYVTNANGRISYSAQQYLQMLAIRMDGSSSLINSATSISQSEMVAIITNMNIEKKDTIAYLWLEAASKVNGDCFGMYCINDFKEEKKVIVSMAEICKVNINNYLYTKHEISSYY